MWRKSSDFTAGLYSNDNAESEITKKEEEEKIYIYHVQTLNAGRLLHILYNMRRVRLLHATCIFISHMTNEEQQFKVWRKRVVLL